ncbi:MAG: hypothetical protein AAGC74_13055 [Verrucomicrobiota bacterium]
MLLGAAALFLASCAPSTPSARIEKNPVLYNQLSLREQELVSQGRIEEGMSTAAVYLALGEPDQKSQGSARGVRTERWDYTALYPIYRNHFYGHYGYGGYGRCRRRYGGIGFGPSIDYVPIRSASVWFENDRVRSWERVRR